MFSIRKGTFETNSSSTHSICVCTENEELEISEELEIDLNDYDHFGWQKQTYTDLDHKLAYLIVAILNCGVDFKTTGEYLDKLYDSLKTIGVTKLKVTGINIYMSSAFEYKCIENDWCTIDHVDEITYFGKCCVENPELLKMFLFSDRSFINTGNDNGDEETKNEYEEEDIPYKHESFFKGN